MPRSIFVRPLALALLPTLLLVACHKQEQAVVNVAQNAVNAEHQAQNAAQAAAAESDRQRAALALIPLPTKGLYMNVHDANAWANPFLVVDAASLSLRLNDPTDLARHGKTPHRKDLQLSLTDLTKALIALPPTAWRYGRVIAVAESTQATPKDRPKLRRNLEAAIQQLNDLGIVVEEWPTR